MDAVLKAILSTLAVVLAVGLLLLLAIMAPSVFFIGTFVVVPVVIIIVCIYKVFLEHYADKF